MQWYFHFLCFYVMNYVKEDKELFPKIHIVNKIYDFMIRNLLVNLKEIFILLMKLKTMNKINLLMFIFIIYKEKKQ